MKREKVRKETKIERREGKEGRKEGRGMEGREEERKDGGTESKGEYF